jgi:ABC-type polar amino acid transport system ATPase subunit
VLDELGLSGRDKYRNYSLGMKQRLAIAATLLKDPDLLIFDEPTNGLDPAGIHEIRTMMRSLARRGKTPHPRPGLLVDHPHVGHHRVIADLSSPRRDLTHGNKLRSSPPLRIPPHAKPNAP